MHMRFSRENVVLTWRTWWKIRENAMVLHHLTVNNFNLTRNILKSFSWKIHENATALHYFNIDHFNLTRKIAKII